MPPSAPTAQADRLEVLDALRGFALIGVLLVNLRDFSLYGLLSEAARTGLPGARWDAMLETVLGVLVDGKSATLFCLLFGVGFALQMERAADDPAVRRRYLRRVLILLGIGVAHAYLLWWGDILRYYALMGLALVPLARWSPRTLALLGVFTALFAAPLLRPWVTPLLPAVVPLAEARQTALAAFGGDSLRTMLRVNLDYDLRMRIVNWSLLFFVLGRLLIGAALGRAGVFADVVRHRAFWRRLLAGGLLLGALLTAFVSLRDHGLYFADGWWKGETARNVSRVARGGSSLFLALGYMAAFVLLFQHAAWRKALQPFVPIGRMALTNYLAQTMLALALFYGVGLGIGPRWGLAGTVLACAAIFALQLLFSRWWLARFRFGPAEWAWRCLTYGSRQPLRRSPSLRLREAARA